MAETSKHEYPYLGRNFIGDKHYIVMFTEPDYGVVVDNETDSEKIKVGYIGDFDESKFEFLPEGEYVQLEN